MKKEKPLPEINKEKITSEPKPKTSDEKKEKVIEDIKKTLYPAFLGAGFAYFFFTKFNDASKESWYIVLLFAVLLSYYIQRFLYPFVGIKVKEFEIKDWLYVEFFLIIYMLVFWVLLLN